MRKARTPLFLAALVLIAGSAAFAAQQGIEVLQIIPVGEGCLVESITNDAPAGSYMEAVMYVGAFPIVVDCAPIDAAGFSVVHFPHAWTHNVLVARGPNGEVLQSRSIKIGGIVEIDNI
jgi:hypothetical protein